MFRLEPFRCGRLGLTLAGSDVSAPSAQMDDQPRQRAHGLELTGKPHRISAFGAERCPFQFAANEHLFVSAKEQGARREPWKEREPAAATAIL
jgi:hypothetical protein